MVSRTLNHNTPFTLKVTVTLHPDLAALIETRVIQPGNLIVLNRVTLHADSASVKKPRTGVFVHSIRLVELEDSSEESTALGEERNKPTRSTDVLEPYRPVFTKLSHYLSRYSDDAMDFVLSWDRLSREYNPICEVPLEVGDGGPGRAMGKREGLSFLQTGSSSASSFSKTSDILGVAQSAVGGTSATGAQTSRNPSLTQCIESWKSKNYSLPLKYPHGPKGQPPPTMADIMVDISLAKASGGRKRGALGNSLGAPPPLLPQAPFSYQGAELSGGGGAGGGGDIWQGIDGAGEEEGPLKKAAGTASLPLLGRLVTVGRIVHWGSSRSLSTTYPFKFTFRIMDSSRAVDVTCWNGAAMRWHAALRGVPLGALIGVCNYKAKVDDMGNVDIALEANGPEGWIVRLPPQSITLFPLSRFPHPELRIISSMESLASGREGKAQSFAGVITRVGPICRTPCFDADVDGGGGGGEPRGGRPPHPPGGGPF